MTAEQRAELKRSFIEDFTKLFDRYVKEGLSPLWMSALLAASHTGAMYDSLEGKD